MYSFRFDVIFLSEIHVVENLFLCQIPEYDIYYNNSKNNRNDGVIMYISSDTKLKTIALHGSIFLRVEMDSAEGRMFGITSIYFSPPSALYETYSVGFYG